MLANQGGVGLLNFAASVAVARALGPTGRGAVAVGLVLLALLMQLGSLGLATANPYFTARDRALAGPLVPAALWLAATIGGVLIGLVTGLKWIAPSSVASLTWLQTALVVFALPAALAAIFLQSVLLGQGRTVAYNAVQLTLSAISVAALLIIAVTGHLHTGLALVLLLAQYPVSVLIYLRLLSSDTPLISLPDLGLLRQLVRFGLRSYASTVLSFLVIRLDLMLVNAYLGAKQAGLYSVAVVVAQAMYLFPVAVGLNILPRAARGAPAAATAQVFRIVATIYGLMCLVSVPLAAPLIHWMFGTRFGPSVRMFYWLLPGIFALGMLVILGSDLAGRGYPRRATLIWAGGLAFNVVANMLLLPRYGTYMASLVSSVTYTGVLLLHVRLFTATPDGDVRLWPRPRELRLILPSRSRAR
jgi:O-antigen/teichoic acid export membrane protein